MSMLRIILFSLCYLTIVLDIVKGLHFDNVTIENEQRHRNKRSLSYWRSSLRSLLKTEDGDIFNILRDNYSLPAGIKSPYMEYDFIVVGAGSAGSALAGRLSENKNWNVLLLEVGGPELSLGDAPLLAATLQSTDYNWMYRPEKMKGRCLAMEDQQCHWPKGRAIGGSSSINYMIYTRGKRADWDGIAADGNPGWSYNDVLQYYLKMENANLRERKDYTVHGRDGPMSVEHLPFRSKLVDTFLEAGREIGFETIDYNSHEGLGFGYVQSTTKQGRRFSSSKAYLHPHKDRKNLHILPFTWATKVLIDKATKSAHSVEYVRNKKKYVAKAKKEIILSAGVFMSPQLLMLSGVGPVDHLEEMKIEPIKDLPVGKVMYDHLGYIGNVFLINQTNMCITEDRLLTLNKFMEWLKYGEGEISLIGGVEALGYMRSKYTDLPGNLPDVEFIFSPGSVAADRSETVRKGMKITDDFFREVYGKIVGRETWTVAVMLLHPKSRGYMRLKDKNPFHRPKLYYDYFSDERDLLAMVEGIKQTVKLSKTKAFQRFGSRLHDKPLPTCRTHTFGSDEYWKCAVKTLSSTLHHQIATCKMGPANDPEAVVDHELRVHGIKGLRVADTSIIPRPITAHTNAPAIMIGEKLADILKKQYM